MDENDRLNGLLKLVEFRLRRWDARRDAEWKISLGLWTLLAAAALYVPGIKIQPGICVIIISMLVIFVVYIVWWSMPTTARNVQDMETAFFYVEHAERILGLREEKEIRKKPKDKRLKFSEMVELLLSRGFWAAHFQIIATALVLIAAGWLLSRKP